jgi:hypothetical protein
MTLYKVSVTGWLKVEAESAELAEIAAGQATINDMRAYEVLEIEVLDTPCCDDSDLTA